MFYRTSHPGLTSKEISGHEQSTYPSWVPTSSSVKKRDWARWSPKAFSMFRFRFQFSQMLTGYSVGHTSFILQSLLQYLLSAFFPRGEQGKEGCRVSREAGSKELRVFWKEHWTGSLRLWGTVVGSATRWSGDSARKEAFTGPSVHDTLSHTLSYYFTNFTNSHTMFTIISTYKYHLEYLLSMSAFFAKFWINSFFSSKKLLCSKQKAHKNPGLVLVAFFSNTC